jgi:putative addiction module killer protein
LRRRRIRLYFTMRNKQLIVLLCGGDKSSQHDDIKQAKKLIKDL